MVQFITGTEAAEAAQASGGKFSRIDYLSLKGDGDQITLRFITDHNKLLSVAQHFSPTRTAPEGYEGKWPKSMPASCRNDIAFKTDGTYPDCALCNKFDETKDERNYKPKMRSWAIAAVRTPLMHEGRQIGMQDHMVEMEVDGKKTMVPELLWVNMAYNNFFGHLASFSAQYGTWCDRDYQITRKGTGTDTEYRPVPLEPSTLEGYDHTAVRLQRAELIEQGKTGAELPPEAGPIFDTRIPEHAARYYPMLQVTPEEVVAHHGNDPQTMAYMKTVEIVMERSEDEYYAKFFDERMPQPAMKKKGDKEGESASTPPPAPAQNAPDQSQLDALASRVQGYGGATAAPVVPEMSQPASTG